uniref:Ig-like domain-containing protein n=1 Tax=Sander lucioperca TaxID=283035 RepID=A0A8C9ZMC3_SANLU
MLFSSLGNTMEDDITASSAEVFSSEGRSVTLSCTYSVKAENLQWYRQDPGSAPQFLLLITDTTSPSVVEATPPHPRLNATLNKEKNQVDLKIISAEVSDSAVYYCALRPTVTGNTKTLYKNLWSKDNTILHNIHQRESYSYKLQHDVV